MQAILNQIRTYTTDMIVEAVEAIGGGNVDTETRMVRAALIEVYGEREGFDAADSLMDKIGM